MGSYHFLCSGTRETETQALEKHNSCTASFFHLSSKHFWDNLMDHRHWHKDKQHQPYPPTWVHGPIQRTEIQIAKKRGKRLPEKGHTQIRRGRLWVTLWW